MKNKNVSREEKKPYTNIARAELDSHADTCCMGKAFKINYHTNQVCDVAPFNDSYEAMAGIQVTQGLTAYDKEETRETYIGVVSQGLDFTDTMEHSLLCPNQMRANGMTVDDVPKHLSHDRSSTHASKTSTSL